MALAQALIVGLPPHYQRYLDGLSEDGRRRELKMLADDERKDRRKHDKQRASLIAKEGYDIGPYDSIYDWLWREEERRHAKNAGNYGILGLELNTDLTKRDVRKAYYHKAQVLHPDVGGDAEAFKQLYFAYRTLLKIAI
jgi:DnaJ-like protein